MANSVNIFMVLEFSSVTYSAIHSCPMGEVGSNSFQAKMGSLVMECVMAKIPFSCSRVIFVIGLSAFTITHAPPEAILISTTSTPESFLICATSASVRSRDTDAKSHVPATRSSKAWPEPPPRILNFTSGYSLLNASARPVRVDAMVSEPWIVMDPFHDGTGT